MKQKKTKSVAAQSGTVLVTSGASGGHVYPALAVAEELKKAGMACVFVLGGGKFNNLVDDAGYASVRLPAGAFNDRGIVVRTWGVLKLATGILVAMRAIRRYRPVAVFGTGGYASVATMLAAKLLGVPTFIHEQNVLPGRANRFLARFATHVITTFPATQKFMPGRTLTVLGSPLREAILKVAGAVKKADGTFNLLMLGGSQGARILADVVPDMTAMMTADERKKLRVYHQARPEDLARVREAYAGQGLAEAKVESFFAKMPELYAQCDVVIGRSGTSTLLEAATVGRPAIYVPLQLADGHQLLNAQVAEQAGAAVILPQPEFTPAVLLAHVRGLWQNPAKCKAMADAARTLARPTAAADVAAFVLAHVK